MLSIFIPTYNRFHSLMVCLDSITNFNWTIPYEIVIADGGSTDGTPEYLRCRDDVVLIEQGERTGAVIAINECIKVAKGEYIAGVNDDMVIYPQVYIDAYHVMNKYKNLGLIGVKANETKYNNMHNILLWVKPFWMLIPKLFIVRRSIALDVGLFDTNFYTHGVDVDFPLSVLSKGYTIGVTRDVGVIHNRSEINRGKDRDSSSYDYLFDKWKHLINSVERYRKNRKLLSWYIMFFKRIAARMYFSRFHFDYLFDWCLSRMVMFPSGGCYRGLFLCQRYPSEIVEELKIKEK